MENSKKAIYSEADRKPIQGFYNKPPSKTPQPLRAEAAKPPARSACPESLKNYVTRAFGKCTSDSERDQMEKLVKEEIEKAKSSGNFYSVDWDKLELPLLGREKVMLSVPPAFTPVFTPHIPQVRRSRFQLADPPAAVEIRKQQRLIPPPPPPEPKVKPKKDWKIEGTCVEIEKAYFRLTSKPDPSTIRPEPVLRRALDTFKDRWRLGQIKYEYFSEQLRSIRQDLTVQGIKNKFTVEVYQVHIRLALEAGDLDQFNASMSRLFELFKEGLPGKKTVSDIQEFLAYRIVYFALQNLFLQLENSMKTLSKLDRQAPEIQHALALKNALLIGNYHKVFQLSRSVPNMGIHLFIIFEANLRFQALLKIFNL